MFKKKKESYKNGSLAIVLEKNIRVSHMERKIRKAKIIQK